MQEPKVSVIVTTYNREEYLKETIQSILDQTYKDFELIVVDNFSNYDFFKVIEEFRDSRIRPFQNANNGIIAVNRNYGISKATGKYLAFCDDDDLWEKEKLSIQVEIMDRSPQQVLSSSFIEIDYESKIGKVHKIRDYKDKYDIYRENLTTLSSVIVSNSHDVIFNVDPYLMTIEDYALWIDLHQKGYELHVEPKPLIRYRISSSSSFYNVDNLKKIAIRKIYLYSKMFLQYPNVPIKEYISSVFWNLRYIVVTIIKNGKLKIFFNRS